MHVSGAIPGLCDAVVQLYDSHGGKYAGQARSIPSHAGPHTTAPRRRGERRSLRLFFPAHLSAQGPSLSIPTRLDAFRRQPTPFNSTRTSFARMESMDPQFCVDQLVPAIEEAFFSAPSHTRFARDRDALLAPEFLDKHGFHRGFDDAVVRAFARVDEEVKADHPSGTTAALLFAKARSFSSH